MSMSTYKVWYSEYALPDNWMNAVPPGESNPVYIGPKNASDSWTNNWLDVLKNSSSTFPFQSLTNTTYGVDWSKADSNFFWTKVAKIYTSTPYNLPDGYTGFFETSNISNIGNEYKGLVYGNLSSFQDTQYIWPVLPQWGSNKDIVYNWTYVYQYISMNNKLPITLIDPSVKIPFGPSGPDYSTLFPGITGPYEFDPQLLDGTYLVGQTGPLPVIKPVKFEDAKDLNSYVLKNGSAYQEAKSFFTYIPVNDADESKATDFDYNKFTFNQLVPKNYVDQLYDSIVGEGSSKAVMTLKKFEDILAGNTGIFTDIQSLTKGVVRTDANYYTVQKIDSALEIGNSLKVNGNSFTVGGLLKTSWNELSVSGNVGVSSNLQTQTLGVSGIANFNDSVVIKGDSTVEQTFRAYNDAYVYGNSVLHQDLTVYNDTLLKDSLTVNGSATFNSNVGLDGDLLVSGVTTFNSNVGVDGILSVSGDLGVSSNLQTQTLGVSGIANFNDSVVIKGDSTVEQTFRVYNNAHVYGDSILHQDLTVYNDTLLKDSLTVNGSATFNSNVGLDGDLLVSGVTTFNSNVGVDGILSVSGNVIFNSDSEISGQTTLGITGQTGSSNLVVNGTSLFMGDITYFGKLNCGTGTSVSGNSIITENLDTSRMTVGKQTRKSQTAVLTIDQLDETTTDLLNIKSVGEASVKIDKDGAIKMTSNVSKVQLANKEVDSGVFYINDKWCIVTDDTKSLSFYFRNNPSDDWKCGVKFKTA